MFLTIHIHIYIYIHAMLNVDLRHARSVHVEFVHTYIIYMYIHTPLHPSPHDLPMISLSEFDVRRATDARRV